MSADDPPEEKSREQIRLLVSELLLAGEGALPTSAVRRLGTTALAVLRGGRVLRRVKKQAAAGKPLELEALAGLVGSIGRLKGLSMKLGQMLSYLDVALPDELQAALSALQTCAQPMPFARVREIIEAELGPGGAGLLAEMNQTPVAAASIGQVHRARLPDGTAVAVKVRYPEIERAIANDFGAAWIGTRLQSLLFPHAHIDDFVEEMRQRFLEECDYEHEAVAQQRFGALFSGHPVLHVPPVHQAGCSRSVLTTSFVEGEHFERYLQRDPPQQERDRIGAALFTLYIGTLFRHGVYNCDPHPGNYLFLPGGRVAVLDYGCTREFAPAFVAALRQLTRAVHADERTALERAFIGVGLVEEGRRYDFDIARTLVRGFYGPMLEDRVQAVQLPVEAFGNIFKKKLQLLKLSLPGEFLFLFRIRFGLMSVLSRLGARANWYRLERELVESGALEALEPEDTALASAPPGSISG